MGTWAIYPKNKKNSLKIFFQFYIHQLFSADATIIALKIF